MTDTHVNASLNDEPIDDEIAHRSVQRPRFGMGVDQQDIHGGGSSVDATQLRPRMA